MAQEKEEKALDVVYDPNNVVCESTYCWVDRFWSCLFPRVCYVS